MLGYSSYDTNSQFITVECIELQSDGTYSALKRHLCLPFDIIAKALKSERDELIKSSRWSRAPVIVSPVDSCNPPRRFFDRKLIERRVRNEAKDLKHWSWQVQELMASRTIHESRQPRKGNKTGNRRTLRGARFDIVSLKIKL
jgi:hypothetical protein